MDRLGYLKGTTLTEALTHLPEYDEALKALMERMGWTDERLHVIEHALLSEAICKAQDYVVEVARHMPAQDEFAGYLQRLAALEEERKVKAPTAAETVGASHGH